MARIFRTLNLRRFKKLYYALSPFSMSFHSKAYKSDSPGIFMGGPRSGSTLLRIILGQHSQIYAGYEFVFHYSMLHSFKKFPWLPKKAFLLYEPQTMDKLMNRYGVSREEVLALQARVSCFPEFMDKFFNRAAKRHGKQYWLEKTAKNGNILDFIFNYFPKAKYIQLLRDGRDVVCSLKKFPIPGVKISKAERESQGNPIEIRVAEWMETITEAIKFRGHENYCEVRYEDLVLNPEKTLRDLFTFLGIPFEEKVLDYSSTKFEDRVVKEISASANAVKPLDKSRLERWRRDLSYEEAKYVNKEAGGLLKELGYIDGDEWLDFYNKK